MELIPWFPWSVDLSLAVGLGVLDNFDLSAENIILLTYSHFHTDVVLKDLWWTKKNRKIVNFGIFHNFLAFCKGNFSVFLSSQLYLEKQNKKQKNLKVSRKARKNSSKFVYILAKQCRSPFNLTNFLTKNFQILIVIFIFKTSYLKLIGSCTCLLYAHFLLSCSWRLTM